MSVRSWADYERGLLLGGLWLPVTGCVLFVNASAERCADTLLNGVRGQHVREYYGHALRVRPVKARSLDGLLRALLPLDASTPRRYLLLPTANSEWTAMFDSVWRGQDPQSPMVWFAVAGIESVSVVDIPHTYDYPSDRGFYGARKLEMYELAPDGEAIGHSLGVRTVNTRQWEVVEPSRPFPVGNIWDPMAKRIPDRFTHEHLVEMTGLFGLWPFDEDFYAPDGQGLIVERTDPVQPDEVTYTLGQARREEPVDDFAVEAGTD